MAHSCHAGLGPGNFAELAMIVLKDKMTKGAKQNLPIVS